MSDRFWPDAKASIVLLPSGEQGGGLLDLAAQWTKMGLLGPALWVHPERVSPTESGPPRIIAVVLGLGADLEIARIEVDLFEALAREALAVVRLVKLRSAAPSRELDEVQDQIAERVREYVRKSMPMMNPSAPIVDQAAELKHATLICAPTEFQLKQRVDWVGSEFGVVVIASPEDRSSPWSGDAFVRDDERFVGFTLLHLASVAGLWNGIPTGSFELVRREESGHRSVWLSRVFVNAVLTESLGARAAAHVLAEVARPDSLLVDPGLSAPPSGTVFIEDSDVSAYVDGMVRGALSLDDGALLFRPSTSYGEPARRRDGFWGPIGRFFSFSADKIGRIPLWAWRAITSRTYRQTTRLLHSDEGSEVVGNAYGEVFDVREQTLIAEAELITQDEQRARAEAGAPSQHAHVRTTPALWLRLRELVFGALDGSADLSSAGFVPVDDVVPVFGRVSDVLALPEHPWIAPREIVPEDFPERVDWYALALDDPRERLVEAVQHSSERKAEAESELAEASASLAHAEAATAAAGTPPLPAPPPPAPVPPAAATDPADGPVTPASIRARVDAATAALAVATADADRFADGVQAFDAWAVTQDRSFIWRLLTRLAEERRLAEQRSDLLSVQIDQLSLPRPGALIRLRRRFHRTLIVAWTSGLIIGALLLAGVLSPERSASDGSALSDGRHLFFLWSTIVVAVILVCVTIGALVSYHRGWSRFQRQIDVERSRLVQLGRNARRARQEAVRLRSLHRQTVDWLVLLSRAIHQPWHVPEKWHLRDDPAVVSGAMPFALQIAAIQDADHAATARLHAVMTDHLLAKGWRHAAFEALVTEVGIERGALSSGFGLRTLDEDLPHASNHTRRMLLAALDDEAILTRVAGPRLEALVKAAQRDDDTGARPRVRPVMNDPLQAIARGAGRATGVGDVGWDEFLLGSLAGRRDPMTPLSATVLTDVELRERYHERVQSHLVIPARLAPAVQYPEGTPFQVVAFPDHGNSSVDLSWRVDIAGPVPLAAIHLWDGPRPAAAQSAPARGQDPNADTGV